MRAAEKGLDLQTNSPLPLRTRPENVPVCYRGGEIKVIVDSLASSGSGSSRKPWKTAVAGFLGPGKVFEVQGRDLFTKSLGVQGFTKLGKRETGVTERLLPNTSKRSAALKSESTDDPAETALRWS